MSDWRKYTFQPKRVEDLIKNDSIIVVDTNVLLAIYQWKDVTAESILDSLIKLNSEGRLKVPEHVMFEFSRNRTKIITSAINELSQVYDGLGGSEGSIKKDLKTKLPMLMNEATFKELLGVQSEAVKQTKKYKEELLKLKDLLKEYFFNDPHLKTIQTLINEDSYLKSTKTDSDLENEFKTRVKNNIPPGIKDAGKSNNNSEGDFKIWDSILSLKKDVIFITADNKNDWCHTDNKNNILSARRELIEEFWVHSNKTFSIIHPKDFFVMYNPDLSEEIIDDLAKDKLNVISNEWDVTKGRTKRLKNKEEEKLERLELLSLILFKYDPVGLSAFNLDINEYYYEAREIDDAIMNLTFLTRNKLKKIIKDILEDRFDGMVFNLDSEDDKEMIRNVSNVYSHMGNLENVIISG